MSEKMIDVHNHYYISLSEEEFLEIVRDFDGVIVCSLSLSDFDRIKSLKTRYDKNNDKIKIFWGVHPHNYNDYSLSELKDHFEKNIDYIDGIGEVGMDINYDKDFQLRYLEFFKELAREYNLVMNVHSRGFEEVVYRILRDIDVNIIMHYYSGSFIMPEDNFYISIPPLINRKRRNIIKELDLGRVLSESDFPFAIKDLNKIELVYKRIAEIKDRNENDIKSIIKQNYKKYFKGNIWG